MKKKTLNEEANIEVVVSAFVDLLNILNFSTCAISRDAVYKKIESLSNSQLRDVGRRVVTLYKEFMS